MKLIIFAIAWMLVSLSLADNWKVNADQAKVTFSVKGPFGTVHGSFTGLKANIEFNEKKPESGSLSASVDVKTISTGVGLRNSDLRNEEKWFNVDKYPLIVFKSKSIQKNAAGFIAHGTLTIKEVNKPVSIPFTFTSNNSEGAFKGDFDINREDFNLGDKGGSVGNKVSIHLEVPVNK